MLKELRVRDLALVAESREHADRVAKISVIPRGVAALGYTQQQPTEDRYLMTRAELLDRLDVLLGKPPKMTRDVAHVRRDLPAFDSSGIELREAA